MAGSQQSHLCTGICRVSLLSPMTRPFHVMYESLCQRPVLGFVRHSRFVKRCCPMDNVTIDSVHFNIAVHCIVTLFVSLSHCTVTLSHFHTVSLSHCLTVTLSRWHSVTLSHCDTVTFWVLTLWHVARLPGRCGQCDPRSTRHCQLHLWQPGYQVRRIDRTRKTSSDENPAHGRHWIFRPMGIGAPIQRN